MVGARVGRECGACHSDHRVRRKKEPSPTWRGCVWAFGVVSIYEFVGRLTVRQPPLAVMSGPRSSARRLALLGGATILNPPRAVVCPDFFFTALAMVGSPIRDPPNRRAIVLRPGASTPSVCTPRPRKE